MQAYFIHREQRQFRFSDPDLDQLALIQKKQTVNWYIFKIKSSKQRTSEYNALESEANIIQRQFKSFNEQYVQVMTRLTRTSAYGGSRDL